MSADEDELVAEVVGVLEELVAEKQLELASRRSVRSLAGPLLRTLEKPGASLSDWLLDQNDVTELYLEEEELHHRFRHVVRRTSEETPSKHHPELAAAIIASPEDVQAWSVYADWLQERGDPRGELMALQILGEGTKKKNRPAQERERALLARHRRHFYGDLRFDEGLGDLAEVTFRRGFFDEVTLYNRVDLETVLQHESGRFLRRLTVRSDAVAQLLAARALPATLQHLELGVPVERYGRDGERIDLGIASRSLVRLIVRSHEVVLGPLETPKLRELVVKAATFVVRGGTFSTLPALERLEIAARTLEGVEDLTAMFKAPPPSFHALALEDLENKKQALVLVRALFDSRLVGGALRSLRLSMDLGDAAARVLLGNEEKLRRLEKLDLSGSSFSEAMTRTLQEVFPDAGVPGPYLRPWARDDERYDDVDE